MIIQPFKSGIALWYHYTFGNTLYIQDCTYWLTSPFKMFSALVLDSCGKNQLDGWMKGEREVYG